MVQFHFSSSPSSKAVVYGRCLIVTLPLTTSEAFRWPSSLAIIMQGSVWWWQCSAGCSLPLPQCSVRCSLPLPQCSVWCSLPLPQCSVWCLPLPQCSVRYSLPLPQCSVRCSFPLPQCSVRCSLPLPQCSVRYSLPLPPLPGISVPASTSLETTRR